jgi:hypothetical protein
MLTEVKTLAPGRLILLLATKELGPNSIVMRTPVITTHSWRETERNGTTACALTSSDLPLLLTAVDPAQQQAGVGDDFAAGGLTHPHGRKRWEDQNNAASSQVPLSGIR